MAASIEAGKPKAALRCAAPSVWLAGWMLVIATSIDVALQALEASLEAKRVGKCVGWRHGAENPAHLRWMPMDQGPESLRRLAMGA